MHHWHVVGNLRCLLEDLDDGLAVLQLHGHEDSRHERKMKGHVELVAVAEIRRYVRRPLVGLGQQHLAGIFRVEPPAKLANDRVRLGQILAVGSVALDQVRNRVQPEPVHPDIEPELHHPPHGLEHGGIVVVQIRLVAEKAVPVIGFRDRVPRPVGHFRVQKNDAGVLVAVVGVAPHIPIALGIVARAARFLKPRVLVRGVIQHQLDDHPDSALVRGFQERLEIIQLAVIRMDGGVVGDIVAVVAQRRRKEGHQPQRVDSQVLQVIELLHQAGKIADAVVVAVAERAHVQLVNDGILVPKRLGGFSHCVPLLQNFCRFLLQDANPAAAPPSLANLQDVRRHM